MEKSVDSLVNLIQEKSNTDPVIKRTWTTATIAYEFAELVSSLRKDKGFSENKLAEMAGCSVKVIKDLENPTLEAIPKLGDMVGIADILGYELNVSLNPIQEDLNFDRVKTSVYNTVFKDVRVIGEHFITKPDVNESIAVVAVDAGGHVRLPKGIQIENDDKAFFHSIPLKVKKDER